MTIVKVVKNKSNAAGAAAIYSRLVDGNGWIIIVVSVVSSVIIVVNLPRRQSFVNGVIFRSSSSSSSSASVRPVSRPCRYASVPGSPEERSDVWCRRVARNDGFILAPREKTMSSRRRAMCVDRECVKILSITSSWNGCLQWNKSSYTPCGLLPRLWHPPFLLYLLCCLRTCRTSMFVGELHENCLYADVYIASTFGAAIQVTGLSWFLESQRELVVVWPFYSMHPNAGVPTDSDVSRQMPFISGVFLVF